MVRVALRGLLGRKFRAILTALAVILGVAMISGTFVLTDTINNAFDTLFTDSYTGTDVVISGQQAFETDFGQPPSFDEAVFDDVLALDGVDSAVRAIQDFAVLTNKDGGPITTGGAPTLAFGLDTEAQSDVFERFSPLDLVDGTWPIGLGQVAIDPATANDEGYVVGETIGIRARGPVEDFEIVGLAKFGSVDSIGGVTVAYFSIEQAQVLFEKEGKLDGIQIAGDGTVSAPELISRIEPILPAQTEVVTRRRAGRNRFERCRGVHDVHPVLLARLRRHCVVRWRVRDLQHALDHRRPAYARVRDASHARRLTAPGAGISGARDVHHRVPGFSRRPVPRARARGRPERHLRELRHRPAEQRHRVSRHEPLLSA